MTPAAGEPQRALPIVPDEALLAEVCEGLQRIPKRLSSKFFYDADGSALFEAICAQPEYYLTVAELEIMREHADAIAAALGPDVLLLEYGSGSGLKTELLLTHLAQPVAYVPVEISTTALAASVARLRQKFPRLELLPLVADFTERLTLPRSTRPPRRRVLYFPGSTLGNFETREALALLLKMREEIGAHGAVLIGIDLKKDSAQLDAAYNDAVGVTAAFTLNMLARFNRELGADFVLAQFEHRARYNALAGRIETHIVSRVAQTVTLAGRRFGFAAGEAMLVEYSYKYSLPDFARLAARAGLGVCETWTDAAQRFAVLHLERAPLPE